MEDTSNLKVVPEILEIVIVLVVYRLNENIK